MVNTGLHFHDRDEKIPWQTSLLTWWLTAEENLHRCQCKFMRSSSITNTIVTMRSLGRGFAVVWFGFSQDSLFFWLLCYSLFLPINIYNIESKSGFHTFFLRQVVNVFFFQILQNYLFMSSKMSQWISLLLKNKKNWIGILGTLKPAEMHLK